MTVLFKVSTRFFKSNSILSKTEPLATESIPVPRVSFSSLGNGNPQLSFEKPEVIYAILDFPIDLKGTYVLDVQWARPDGIIQESSAIPLQFPETGSRQANLWLRFHNADGGIDVIRGRAVENDGVYNGVWTLKIGSQGKKLIDTKFSITGY